MSVKHIMPLVVGSDVIIIVLTVYYLVWYQLVSLRKRRPVDNIQVAL